MEVLDDEVEEEEDDYGRVESEGGWVGRSKPRSNQRIGTSLSASDFPYVRGVGGGGMAVLPVRPRSAAALRLRSHGSSLLPSYK